MILPPAAAPFEWRSTSGGPGLVCGPLAAVAPHVFTTRSWVLGSALRGDAGAAERDRGWRQVAGVVETPPADLVRARQVHGTAVSVGRPPDGAPVEADILLAQDAAIAVAVQVADCVPLLLADPRTGAVAAVHAGWRGLALRVPVLAVGALVTEFGCRAEDLLAASGPSIGACCYEVGPEVRARFASAGFPEARLERWFLERPLPLERNPRLPALPERGHEGRWYFDGWLALRDQLAEAGVQPARTFGPELCTASHAAFCSYRRDGADAAGRMAAAIRTASPRP